MTADTDTPPDTPATETGEIPAAFKPSPQAQFAREMAKNIVGPVVELLKEHLPGAVAAGLMTALVQAPSDRPMCWACFERKTRWDLTNADVLRMAFARAQAAGGTDEPMAFIPEELRPDQSDPFGDNGRMPATLEAIVMVGGTGYCAFDGGQLVSQQVQRERAQAEAQAQAEPPAPQQPPQMKRPLIVAPPGMNAHTAVRLAAGDPNLPGMPAQV